MDAQRSICRQVDALFVANKNKGFTLDEIAAYVGVDVQVIADVLYSVVRCPFTKCQSHDTVLSEKGDNGFEIHRCHRCERNFHVQRDATGYSILGWYGE
jgi:hypothetical protein